MKAPDFVYCRAATLDDALRLKTEHGPEARWLAGGQSLLAALAFRLSEPVALIDISRIETLKGVTMTNGVVRIGAATTHAALAASDMVRLHVPLLAEAVLQIAHAAIRNRGTIGGSLAFADPAAELPACCVALDATLVAVGPNGERRIAARDFFLGVYATALEDAELLSAIEVPSLAPGDHHAFVEVTRRSGDYAMAGVAVVVRTEAATITTARAVYFALGDAPVEAKAVNAYLAGKTIDDEHIEAATKLALQDLDPAGDLNGGPAMKRHLAQVVLARALKQITKQMTAASARTPL